MQKRLTAALLCLCLLFTLLPATAFAEGTDLNECKGLEAQPATLSNALPATALAASAPSGQTIYVGDQEVTNDGYWTTDSEGNVTAYSGAGTPSDNYIFYDESTNTLTLHNATIKEDVPYNTSTYVSGAGIGVANTSGDAALTIQLEGQNTLSEISDGIYVYSSSGTASLTITGSGSLTASGSSNGISVVSTSNAATLKIKTAKVTATSEYGIGVSVQADNSFSASLTVEGGSLTASGRKGIHFPEGNPSLNVSDSAIVRASGGIAAGNDETDPVTPSGVGIVFNDKVGTVYGSVTLQENLTIGEDESLNIPSGASLTIPEGTTLTVNGGELTGENIPTEGVVYKVTEVKLDKTSLTLDVNESETLTATITPGNATDQNVTWSSDPNGIVTIVPSTATKTATITATATGTTTITAAVDGKSVTCSVIVNAVQTQTYKVTLVTNGGIVNSGDVTEYAYGVGAALPTDVTRSGYTFAGWYDNAVLSGSPVTAITTADTGNKTYYAKWLSTDAGVASISVNGVTGNISGNQITVTLPPNSALPDGTDDITITTAAGAVSSNLAISTGTESVTYTFTVTAEDGQTTADYTVTVTVAADPAAGNKADVDAAKTTIERHTWTVPQATANTEEAVKAWIEGQLAGMNLNGASYTVTMTGFTAADRGTSADRDGTNGSFAFTVVLSKGTATGDAFTSTYAEATATVTGGTITATAYIDGGGGITETGSGGWTQQVTSPQTGDSSNIGLWLSLMLLSFSGIVALLVTEKVRCAERRTRKPCTR